MEEINLNDSNIMSAKEAALIWGKNSDYVRTSIKKNGLTVHGENLANKLL